MLNFYDEQILMTVAAESHAASIAIDPTSGAIHTWTATGNETLTIAGQPGMEIFLVITCDGSARTIAFSTGFSPSAATIVLTASKASVIHFVHDGVSFKEISRITLA